jgi:hypothetical protein
MKIIQEHFSEIIGKHCWGLKYDRQTNLNLNFGNPFLRIEEPKKSKSKFKDIREHFSTRRVFVNSDYFFWIYLARWKISQNNKTLATNRYSFKKIMSAISYLDGQILEKIIVNAQTGKTVLAFDLGGELIIKRWDSNAIDKLWCLYKHDKNVLSVYSNGFYSYNLSTDKNEEKLKL